MKLRYVNHIDSHMLNFTPLAECFSDGDIEVLVSLRKRPIVLFVVLYHEVQHHLIDLFRLPEVYHGYLDWVKDQTLRKVIHKC